MKLKNIKIDGDRHIFQLLTKGETDTLGNFVLFSRASNHVQAH